MTDTTHPNRTVALSVLISLLVLGTVPGAVVADTTAPTNTVTTATAAEPENADEVLAALREYEGASSLSAYSGLEVMRSQAVTAVQSGGFTDEDLERMRAVLAVLDRFQAAYSAAENGSTDRSFKMANRTSEAIERLEASGGESYATLARLSLERFYRQQGERLYERSRSTANTSAQLHYLSLSATAFEAAGVGERYSTVSARESRIRATYEAERARMQESLAGATAFVEDCGDACSSPVAAATTLGPGVFGTYVDARTAARDATVATRLAEKHGLTTTRQQASSLSASTADALLTLSIAAAALALVYALLVALPAAVLAWRLATWAEDVDGSNVGRIVPQASVEVADE